MFTPENALSIANVATSTMVVNKQVEQIRTISYMWFFERAKKFGINTVRCYLLKLGIFFYYIALIVVLGLKLIKTTFLT